MMCHLISGQLSRSLRRTLARILVPLLLGSTAGLHALADTPVFDAPFLVNANATTDSGADEYTCLVTDEAGVWIAVWRSSDSLGGTAGTDRDIFVSRSTDGGASWSGPALLHANGATDTGDDHAPRLATDRNGNWVAVWYSWENITGSDGPDLDAFVSRSSDDGLTWSTPALLNLNGTTDTASDHYPDITTDCAGNWVAVWESWENLGGLGTDMDILASRSTDNGATWTYPSLLNNNAVTDTGDDNGPRIATDETGTWLVVWRSEEDLVGTGDTEYDLVTARSTDTGLTWTDPALLDTNPAAVSGLQFAVHDVVTDKAGHWLVSWWSYENIGGTAGTEPDVCISRSDDAGDAWSSPALLNLTGTVDIGADYNPDIATDGFGNWLAVWESAHDLDSSGTDRDIVYAQSTDNGATWTYPALLNSNATTDSGSDYHASIATDRAGNWIVIWASGENLGGTAGTDADVFGSIGSLATPVRFTRFAID